MRTAAPEAQQRRRRRALPRPGRRRPRWRPRAPELPAGWTYLRILAGLILGLAVIAGLAAAPLVSLLGLKGPLVRDPHALNLFGNPTGPSASHPLGVDSSGRDVLSRILYGLRSLVLVGLAGTGCAALAGGALAALAALHRGLAFVISLLLGALGAFPPVLLGLGLADGVGPGMGKLIIAVALVALVPAQVGRPAGRRDLGRWLGAVAPWLVRMLATALALDFALTFLGDGPGGTGPQLGAMVARAGLGILRGVPAWWALLFPGLVVVLVLGAAALLGPGGSPVPSEVLKPARLGGPNRRGYLLDRATVALGQAACVIGLAALMFSSLGGSDPGGHPALAQAGRDLPATLSLLLGGGVVWLGATLVALYLGTRGHRRRRWVPARLAAVRRRLVPVRFAAVLRRLVPVRFAGVRRRLVLGWLVRLPVGLVAAAPVGWLAFLALYAFSDSVGKLPLLPGAGTYVGLTHAPGAWARSLLIPWLLLGLTLAARTAPALGRALAAEAGTGQQRVARAAGVPERRLARQRRRALVAPLLALVDRHLTTWLSLSVTIEATVQIAGLGALSVASLARAGAATVADLATLYALAVVAVRLVLDLVRALVDPPVVSTPAARRGPAAPAPEPAPA